MFRTGQLITEASNEMLHRIRTMSSNFSTQREVKNISSILREAGILLKLRYLGFTFLNGASCIRVEIFYYHGQMMPIMCDGLDPY